MLDETGVITAFKGQKDGRPLIGGKNTYARIFIRHKKVSK
jgi:hypothetical protein